MPQMGTVLQFRRAPGYPIEEVDLEDTDAACKILQRELIRLGSRYNRYDWHRIEHETGLAYATIAKMAHGLTKLPTLRTSLKLFRALGWRILAIR